MKTFAKGFTVVEMVIVITTIGILSVLVYTNLSNSRDKAYEARSQAEFGTMVNALKLYVQKYNDYPPDVSRDIAPGTEEFIAPNSGFENWPDAPWPGSVYDYDAWDLQQANGSPGTDGVTDTYQISIRFCDAGGGNCKYPKESWAASFDQHSAYYYCLKGWCRAHASKPVTHPGYCSNCPNHQGYGS